MNNYRAIKVGSNVLLKNGKLDLKTIKNICSSIVFLRKKGIKVILISSGAISLGKFILNVDVKSGTYNGDLNQACATVGRPKVFARWTKEIEKYGIITSQLLLTRKDFDSESCAFLTHRMIDQLLDHDILPIINENDVSSSDEYRFSDNDELASFITKLMLPKKLVIMTNVEGLCDKHPDDGGKLIPIINTVNESIYRLISEKMSSLSKGGMKSKINTAKTIMELGISTHIVNGKTPQILEKIFLGESVGTQVKGKMTVKIKNIKI